MSATAQGAPYQVGDLVVVVRVVDSTADCRDVGGRGRVVSLDYSGVCGESYPTDPMISVDLLVVPFVRESAAGEGALVEHVETLVPSTSREWHLRELKPTLLERCLCKADILGISYAWRLGDFLAASAAGEVPLVDLAITNPGFSRAIEWAAAELKSAYHVALHLPLATLETPERCAFFLEHPCDVYPLSWRPDYDGRGGFNRPVAWFVWGPGRGGRWYPLKKPRTL